MSMPTSFLLSRRTGLLVATAAALQACASRQGATGTTAGSAPATPAPAAAAAPADTGPLHALDGERKWLQQLFEGTPVVVAQRNDGAVSVEVPLTYCFDSGRSAVKPPLGAVLDRVARSLLRQPKARLPLLAAPADANGDLALARQRAQQMRAHLRARGVPESRLGAPVASATAAVQLRLQPA
jgi:outer membrane protein OmpA-like peptidoglycan-associated protein